ncbi:hypothetical protein HW555_006525, partial [Spodoptera exigua]
TFNEVHILNKCKDNTYGIVLDKWVGSVLEEQCGCVFLAPECSRVEGRPAFVVNAVWVSAALLQQCSSHLRISCRNMERGPSVHVPDLNIAVSCPIASVTQQRVHLSAARFVAIHA